MTRNRQKQIWADIDFCIKLEELKAKRLLAGMPLKNMAELTREIISLDSFKNLENELVNQNKIIKKNQIRIRFDGRIY